MNKINDTVVDTIRLVSTVSILPTTASILTFNLEAILFSSCRRDALDNPREVRRSETAIGVVWRKVFSFSKPVSFTVPMRGITFATVLKKLFHFSLRPMLGRGKEEWLVTGGWGTIIGVGEGRSGMGDVVSLATQLSSRTLFSKQASDCLTSCWQRRSTKTKLTKDFSWLPCLVMFLPTTLPGCLFPFEFSSGGMVVTRDSSSPEDSTDWTFTFVTTSNHMSVFKLILIMVDLTTTERTKGMKLWRKQIVFFKIFLYHNYLI